MGDSINDILMTCAFCGGRKRFGEMNQVCLRPLTEEETEKFKKDRRTPFALEVAMRCDKCKEKGNLRTLDGYSVDTEPVKVIPYEKTMEIAIDRELDRMRSEWFKKRRR